MKIEYYRVHSLYIEWVEKSAIWSKNYPSFQSIVDKIKKTNFVLTPNFPTIRYSNYNFSLPEKWENCSRNHYEYTSLFKNTGCWHEQSKSEGYYQLSLGEIKMTVNEKDSYIKWESPVFVQFFKCRVIQMPEIREIGKPYQPATYKEEIYEQSDVVPLLSYCGYSPAESYFSLEDNHQWKKFTHHIAHSCLYVVKETLEIEDI